QKAQGCRHGSKGYGSRNLPPRTGPAQAVNRRSRPGAWPVAPPVAALGCWRFSSADTGHQADHLDAQTQGVGRRSNQGWLGQSWIKALDPQSSSTMEQILNTVGEDSFIKHWQTHQEDQQNAANDFA